jgi:hypothetical protein
MDQRTIAFVVAGALTAGCVALVVYAFRRSIEALGAPAQVEGLARTLGGTTLGPLQWAAPWGPWQSTAGAELVLRKPRRFDLDPAFIRTALGWLQPIAAATGAGS